MRRTLPLLALLALVACGPEREVEVATPAARTETGEAAPKIATTPAMDPSSLAGSYAMEGTTTETQSKRTRKISGTVIIAMEGSNYTSTFSLKTTYPTPDGPLPADVIGKGSGVIEGNALRGTAHTQLVMATVPGVDTGFAFVPRFVGPRILSKSVGTLQDDSTLVIEVENEAEPGETYPPTRTTLRGKKLPDTRKFPTSRK